MGAGAIGGIGAAGGAAGLGMQIPPAMLNAIGADLQALVAKNPQIGIDVLTGKTPPTGTAGAQGAGANQAGTGGAGAAPSSLLGGSGAGLDTMG